MKRREISVTTVAEQAKTCGTCRCHQYPPAAKPVSHSHVAQGREGECGGGGVVVVVVVVWLLCFRLVMYRYISIRKEAKGSCSDRQHSSEPH